MLDTPVRGARWAEVPNSRSSISASDSVNAGISRKSGWRWWMWPSLVAASVLVSGAAWQQVQPGQLDIDEAIRARNTIAVLPLADDYDSPEEPALGKLLADDIVTEMLARGMPKKVLGRSLTGSYDAGSPDVARISRELKVRYVINGRVTRVDDGVKVVSYLTDVPTGEMMRLDESNFASKRDALQSPLAQRIAMAFAVNNYERLKQRFGPGGQPQDVVDTAMLGWSDINTYRGREDLMRARRRFESAIRVDPRSSWMWQGICVAHLIEMGSIMSSDLRQQLIEADLACRNALLLSPNVPENLAAYADVLRMRRDIPAALAVLEKALTINPTYTTAHVQVAHVLTVQGRHTEAQQHIQRVLGLPPINLRQQRFIYGAISESAFARGEDADAEAVLRKWIAEFPRDTRPLIMLSALNALHGRSEEAAAVIARLLEIAPLATMNYVQFLFPEYSGSPTEWGARLIAGLRAAGLPEGAKR